MSKEIFSKIDYKLLEIISLIEHEPNFPILAKDIDTYISNDFDNIRLYKIYMEIANLRKI